MENKKIKQQKENELKEENEDNHQMGVTVTPPSTRKRGAKRQNDVKDVTDAKPSKKSRKAKLTEASILNVIDQEELEKRAAKVIDSELYSWWLVDSISEWQEESDDEEINEEAKTEEKVPDLFDGGTMRPYQIQGFQWLVVKKLIS